MVMKLIIITRPCEAVGLERNCGAGGVDTATTAPCRPARAPRPRELGPAGSARTGAVSRMPVPHPGRPAACLPACLSSSARPAVRPTRPGHLDIGNQLGEGKRRGPRYETDHVTATPDGAHSFSTQPRGSVSARSGSEAAQRALPALRLDTKARLPTLARPLPLEGPPRRQRSATPGKASQRLGKSVGTECGWSRGRAEAAIGRGAGRTLCRRHATKLRWPPR